MKFVFETKLNVNNEVIGQGQKIECSQIVFTYLKPCFKFDENEQCP